MAASTTQADSVSLLVSPTAPRLWIILSLLSLYFIWGSTYLAIRIAIVSFPPLLMTGFRFVLAGAIIFGFLRWRGAAMPTRLQARNAAIIGVMLLAGGTVFDNNTLHVTLRRGHHCQKDFDNARYYSPRWFPAQL